MRRRERLGRYVWLFRSDYGGPSKTARRIGRRRWRDPFGSEGSLRSLLRGMFRGFR